MSTVLHTEATPSEVVRLHAEVFAGAVEGGAVRALGNTDAPGLSATEFAFAALSAAILAHEQAGARLEPGKRKQLLGLFSTRTLYLHPAASPARDWPEHTWEAKIARAAAKLAPKGKNDVMEIIYTALGRTPMDAPAAQVVAHTEASLCARGWAGESPGAPGPFGRRKDASRCELTPAGEAALAASTPGAVRELLARCEQERPEIWALLRKGIRDGFAWTTPSNSD